MHAPQLGVDPLGSAQRAALVAHYQRVVPWLLPHVAEAPLIVALYPDGLGTPPTFLASLHADPAQEYPYFLGYQDETGTGAGEG